MSAPKLQAYLLVFNADWSLRGGLSYLAARLQGDEPCVLCHLTYGDAITKKADWRRCEQALVAPVREVYRNQASDALLDACSHQFPAVVAETSQGLICLLGPAALAALEDSPAALDAAVRDAVAQAGITVG